jgi:tRNA threonylcarbamoyladenosine biosynthesis protein TsaE
MVLNHLDVYRLENVQEAEDLGLGELLEGGVTLIEWGDTIAPVLPADYLELRFTFGEDDDDRNLATRIVGPTWSARQRTITELLGPWAC